MLEATNFKKFKYLLEISFSYFIPIQKVQLGTSNSIYVKCGNWVSLLQSKCKSLEGPIESPQRIVRDAPYSHQNIEN